MVSTISEKVDFLLEQYHSLPKQSDDRKMLYGEIISSIRELIYFLPQEQCGLNEEDSAEFMLEFESRIHNIIEVYQPEQGNFKSFIFPLIQKNIRGFKKNKKVQERREESILLGHVAYELLEESETPTEDMAVAEVMRSYGLDEDIVIKRLKFIFSKYELARKRFYIYFIVHSPLMRPEYLVDLCHRFKFNLSETLQIVAETKKKLYINEDALEHAVQKRNEYFGKQLYVEKELSILRNFTNEDMKIRLQNNLERYKRYFVNQETIIKRNLKQVPRSVISKMFGIRTGTVALYCFSSDNLVNWCSNAGFFQDDPYSRLGVPIEVLHQARNEIQIENYDSSTMPIFNPFEVFDIDKVELSD